MSRQQKLDKLSEPTVYKNWIVSLQPNLQIKEPINLQEDSKQMLLLQIFEILRPNSIDWQLIERSPTNYYKKLSNLTLLFEAMKQGGIVVLSIRPADILENKTSALFALLWNFMRVYFLEQVTRKNAVEEDLILEWAANFSQVEVKLGTSKIDEIINGEDRDFFYNDMLNGNEEFIIDFQLEILPGKTVIQAEFFEPEKIAESFETQTGTEFKFKKDGFLETINDGFNLRKKQQLLSESLLCEIMNFDYMSNEIQVEEINELKVSKFSQHEQKLSEFININSQSRYFHPFANFESEKPKETIIKNEKLDEKSENYFEEFQKKLSDNFYNKFKIQFDEKTTAKFEKLKKIGLKISQNFEMNKKKAEINLNETEFDFSSLIFSEKPNFPFKNKLLLNELIKSEDYLSEKHKILKNFKPQIKDRLYPFDFCLNEKYRKEIYKTLKLKFSSSAINFNVQKEAFQSYCKNENK